MARRIQICSLALLFSRLLDSSWAWVPSTIANAGSRPRWGPGRSPYDGRLPTRCLSDNGEAREEGTDRRKFFSEILSKASAIAMIGFVGSDVASAADSGDILDQFGLDLAAPSGVQQQVQRSSRWPRESPSPLPTRKKSAQELTRDPDPPESSSSSPEAPGADANDGNDMAKALRDASRKKRIDPRTHG